MRLSRTTEYGLSALALIASLCLLQVSSLSWDFGRVKAFSPGRQKKLRRQVAPRNQSKVVAELEFKNGKLFASEKKLQFYMSAIFCGAAKCSKKPDGTLTLADRRLVGKLLKKLNHSLARMVSFDVVASNPLFAFPQPVKPEAPEDDASQEEKAAYAAAVAAYENYLKGLEAKSAELRAAIEGLSSTKNIRTFSGSWNNFFAFDENDLSVAGPFEKWRSEALASEIVRGAFCSLCHEVKADTGDEFCDQCGRTCGQEHAALVLADRSTIQTVPFQQVFREDLPKSFLIFEDVTSDIKGDGFLTLFIRDPLPLPSMEPESSLAYDILPTAEAPFVFNGLKAAGMSGSFWSQEEIASAITDFYSRRGYVVNVLARDDERRQIEVRRMRLGYIKLPYLDESDRRKLLDILQRVLPGNSFDRFVDNEKATDPVKYLRCSAEEGPGQACLIDLKLPGELDANERTPGLEVGLDFISGNEFIIAKINSALREIDYEAALLASGSDSVDGDAADIRAFLAVAKTGGESLGASPTPTPQSASTDPSTEGQVPTSAHAVTPAPVVTPTPIPSPPTVISRLQDFLDGNLYKICPRNNNWFYGGLDHRPGQGTKLIGGYKCLKAGPGVFGIELGTDGAILGSVNYSDTVSFFKIGERTYPVSFQFAGYSDHERNRVFAGVRTNERRSGGSFRAVMPLFRPVARNIEIEGMVEAKRETVELRAETGGLSRHNLTTFETGVRLFYNDERSIRATRFEVKPQVKFGSAQAPSDSTYTVFTATSSLHRELNFAFDGDLKARADWASSRTPIFEQPSFNGQDFVRGFRKDDAIALSLWAVQSELWLRLRGVVSPAFSYKDGGQNKFRDLIRNNVSLAVFFDVGGAYRTAFTSPGSRTGGGIGIRFNYQRVALFKLDWAHGIGKNSEERRSGQFYFTVELSQNPF